MLSSHSYLSPFDCGSWRKLLKHIINFQSCLKRKPRKPCMHLGINAQRWDEKYLCIQTKIELGRAASFESLGEHSLLPCISHLVTFLPLTTFPGYSSSNLGSHCWLLGNPQENWNIFHAGYQPADTSWHPVSDWVVSHSLVVNFPTCS